MRVKPLRNGPETDHLQDGRMSGHTTLGPLAGYTIGITADRRWEEQAELLVRRGARVVHGPAIRTLPLGGELALREATDDLIARPPDAVLLTTALGTRGWFAAADSLGCDLALRDALSQARVYARGPKAAGAALTAGLDVVWKAPSARSLELIGQVQADLAAGVLGGMRLAVQLDGSDDTYIQDQLRAQGFDVVEVPVYRWTLPIDTQPALRLVQGVADHSLDAATFTARPAVRNFFALADANGLAGGVLDAFNSGAVECVCIGPVCAEAAHLAGVTRTVEPVHARLGAMVQACATEFDGRSHAFRMAGRPVLLQGRLVTVGDEEPIALSARERDVLEVLAERPGVVHSKAALLKSVWSNGESDEHVVEVTVGRLRQRLGAAGDGVETVMRRGYRLSAE
jgi:uroporphyrinogen-III synthase